MRRCLKQSNKECDPVGIFQQERQGRGGVLNSEFSIWLFLGINAMLLDIGWEEALAVGFQYLGMGSVVSSSNRSKGPFAKGSGRIIFPGRLGGDVAVPVVPDRNRY